MIGHLDMTKKVKTECVINNVRQEYDACAEGDLENAKKYYGKNFKYIGSGTVYFINGTKNEESELHHYFIHKHK